MGHAGPPRLSAIAEAAALAPPALQAIAAQYQVRADYQWFSETVERLLPEHRETILAQPDLNRTIFEFCGAFEQEYFPLSEVIMFGIAEWEYDPFEGDRSPLGLIQSGPPFEVHGFECQDMHQMWQEHGAAKTLLMMLLGPDRDLSWRKEEETGMRISWFDAAMSAVDLGVLARIPEPPWRARHVIECLERSEMPDAAQTCRWLTNSTDVWLADVTIMEESWGDPGIYDEGWGEDHLEEMATEWAETKAILDAVNRTIEWMDENPNAALGQLVNAIETHIDDVRRAMPDEESNKHDYDTGEAGSDDGPQSAVVLDEPVGTAGRPDDAG